MANTKKGKKVSTYGQRKIEPRVSPWKKLGIIFAKVGAVIITVLGVVATFGELQPTLLVDPKQHPSDIQKTEIVLKNEGLFTLEDVEVDLQFLWLELSHFVAQPEFSTEPVFLGEKLPLDPIPRGESVQIRLPFLMQDQNFIRRKFPQHAIDLWRRVGVCLHVSFRSFPYLSWRIPPFSKVTHRYGLMADREDDTITLSQKRSCSYVERWVREHAISATFKQKIIMGGGRYLHRIQDQKQP